MKIDFNVNISKLTKGVTQRGFGTILILDTTKEHPYTLYNGIEGVAEDFDVEAETYKIASRIFGQNPAPQELAIAGTVSEEPATLVTFLNTVVANNSDWFFLTCSDNSDDVVKALSNWIDTQNKMYFATVQNLEIFEELESENTALMYHDDINAYVAEGLASYLATATVGGVTAKFKTINGVKAANISPTELDELHKNNGFSYVRKMGVLQTTEGMTTSGEYIDVVMGSYFIKFRMEEEAMLLAVNSPKIPYTNEGIGMLVTVAESVLKQATTQGIVLEEDEVGQYEINYIKREDVAKNDVANRVYDGITWVATLAGAIHDGTINGSLVL